jgi:hypothetical protein
VFDRWRSRALERFDALKIDNAKLLNSIDLVAGAVGTPWLEEQSGKRDRPGRTICDVHPLYRELTSAADTSLVAVCELAEYLETFLNDPSMPDILKDLRSDKYEATFFELAMAYRWLKADAEVKLQPPTPRGTADFEATLHGLRFVVEASIFPSDIFKDVRFRIPMIITSAVDSAVGKECAIAVQIQIKEYPPGDFEGAFRAVVKEACISLAQNLHQGITSPLMNETAFGTIRVEPITETTETVPQSWSHFAEADYENQPRQHWDVCFRAVRKHVPPGAPVYRAVEDEAETEHLRVFVNFPEPRDDSYVRIAKKIQKEARQLRGIEAPRVVVLDVAGVAPDALELQMDQLRDEIQKLMKSTPELACVWLMSRGWSTEFRYQYRGVYIPNTESVFWMSMPRGSGRFKSSYSPRRNSKRK